MRPRPRPESPGPAGFFEPVQTLLDALGESPSAPEAGLVRHVAFQAYEAALADGMRRNSFRLVSGGTTEARQMPVRSAGR